MCDSVDRLVGSYLRQLFFSLVFPFGQKKASGRPTEDYQRTSDSVFMFLSKLALRASAKKGRSRSELKVGRCFLLSRAQLKVGHF